jgi:hypothetical protein
MFEDMMSNNDKMIKKLILADELFKFFKLSG